MEIIGIYGAINRLSKSMSNVIGHLHVPLFIEYLRAEFKRKTMSNVVEIQDVILRPEKHTDMTSVNAFVSDSCNCMRDILKTLQNYYMVK